MSMFNPPHPGEFIKATYIEPFPMSQNEIADNLGVARSTFSRLIRGDSGISPDMSLRLSKVLGRTAESWLNMQSQYDLFLAEKTNKGLAKLELLDFNSFAADKNYRMQA